MIGIIRPVNLLLLFVVQFTLWYRLCLHNEDSEFLNFIFLSLSVACTAAAGYVINDIFDIKPDLINKYDKVFIDRKISKKNAYALYYLLNFFSLVFVIVLLDPTIILITVTAIYLLHLYSKKLKNTVLTGNLTIALLSILPIAEIYFHFNSNHAETEFLAYAIFAFFTTVLREIVKDCEDKEGDIKSGIKTLANSISDRKLKLVLFFIDSFLLFCLVVFFIYLNNFAMLSLGLFLILMISPALIILLLITRLKHQNNYKFLSFFIKIYMFLGIIRIWF